MLGATFKSYGGITLPADRYLVKFDPQDNRTFQVSTSALLVERGPRAPIYSSQRLRARTLQLGVKVIDAANASTLTDDLLRAFDTAANQTARLIVADAAGRDWYADAKVTEHKLESGLHQISLLAPDGIWISDDEVQAAAWNIASSPDSEVFTVAGTHPAKPVIAVTPTALRSGGFAYRRFVTIYNRSEADFVDYPIELTGGLNSAALVSAGKLQADGDDLRVYVDGKQAPRWLADMNTTSTKVWVNLDLSPAVSLLLEGALGTGALSLLHFEATKASRNALKDLPRRGLLLIDSELFSYTDVDATNYTVSGVKRAVKWTAPAAHADGASVRWIEHDIRLVYGNSIIAAPTQSDKSRPMLNLGASSNTSWDFDEFAAFQVPTPETPNKRSGQWVPARHTSTGGLSGPYTGNRGAETVPATELGLHGVGWTQGSQPRAEQYELDWSIRQPAGVTAVAMDGEKYRAGALWAAKALLQASENGRIWIDTAQNISSPGSASTWTAWSTNGSLGATYYELRLRLEGTLAAAAGVQVYVEAENVTLTLDSAQTPSVSLGSEQADTYQLEFTLTNQTSGESFSVDFPMQLGEAVTIDCENKTIRHQDQGDIFPALNLERPQSEWMTLTPGSNTLEFKESGLVAVTVELSWHERDGGL